MNIREATPNDAPIVVELIHALSANEGGNSPIHETYVRYYLEHAQSKILLAEENGDVLGMLSYSVRPDLYHAGTSGYIEALVVHEKARGRGAGSALVKEILRRGREGSWAEISVSTGLDNKVALGLYRRHGLTEEAMLLEQHMDI